MKIITLLVGGIFSIVIKRVAHLNCTVVVSLIIVSVDIVFYFVGHLLGGQSTKMLHAHVVQFFSMHTYISVLNCLTSMAMDAFVSTTAQVHGTSQFSGSRSYSCVSGCFDIVLFHFIIPIFPCVSTVLFHPLVIGRHGQSF